MPNDLKEPIMIIRHALIASLALLLPLFAQAELAVPTIPPARAFKWDISRANSTIVHEFVVKDYRMYGLHLAFGGLDATEADGYVRESSDQSWRKQLGRDSVEPPYDGPLSKFLGTGTYGVFTNEPNNLKPVIPKTIAEVQQRDELLRQGVYVTKLTNPGVIVPIHVRLEKLDTPDTTPVQIFDRVVETAGLEGGGYLLTRKITKGVGLPLKPGKYRISATTLRDSPVPTGIGTYLLISVPANVSPPKD